MFKKLTSFAGWVILLCLLLLISFYISISNEWSTIAAIFLWIGITATITVSYGIFLLLNRLYRDGRITKLFYRMRLSRMEYVLSEHWAAGASVIKRIQRKKPKLPWYILTGNRCGKTTLLASSGLPMFSHDPQNNAVVPTRTLRWWFFRTVGFLDLSSLFLSKDTRFERAWHRLTQWCKRLPTPAGVIVCVPVRDLLDKDPMTLHLEAQQVRTQLGPLIKALKRRLPVYLLITCCDEMPGFSPWAGKLSEQQRKQALGYSWNLSPFVDSKDPAFLSEMFTALKQGLDLVRINMLDGSTPTPEQLSLLNFPEQVTGLQPALQRYLGALCEPDIYFETAPLGGVWFTASEQVGKNSSARQALFLHELLTERLPALSHSRDVEFVGPLRRFYQYAGRPVIAGLVMLSVLLSGVLSAELMQGDPDKLAPGQLVDALQRLERWHAHPLRYFPFIPLLQRRHQQVENALVAKTDRQPALSSAALIHYRQQAEQAQPALQRQFILALAHTILQQQRLSETDSLAAFLPATGTATALNLTGATQVLPVTQDVALQRALMHRAEGASQIAAMRSTLRHLIENDSESRWLTAPSSELPAVSLSDFWTLFDADDARVDGRWTLAGEHQVQGWMAQVQLALADKTPPNVFAAFTRNWPRLRQDAWLPLILSMSRAQYKALTPAQWQNLLMDTDKGKSPAQQLARRIVIEMASISKGQAEPWLNALRHLDALRQQAGFVSTGLKVERFDHTLRQKLSALFRLKPRATAQNLTDSHLAAWLGWQTSLHAAVADIMGAPESSNSLTRGLFTPTAGAEKNPLNQVFHRYELLHTNIAAGNDDVGINAVWSLYKSDARLLLERSLAGSACWLQRTWQSQVLWPMEKNADSKDYAAQQDLVQQYLSDFIRGPAKSVLAIGKEGPHAGEYQGEVIPLTPEFMHLVNNVLKPEDVLAMPQRETTRSQDALAKLNVEETALGQQLNALEAKSYTVELLSQPATIPGGARLLPVGTRLMLACDDQNTSLSSMNFSEKASFRWRPGHCSRVSLVVVFPGFELQYDYAGDNAWPDFLTDFAKGEHAFDAADFGSDEKMLTTLGIRRVLVRYQTGQQDATQQAWQNWQVLDARRSELSAQRQTLNAQTSEEEFPTTLTGKISQLPATVAVCP